MHEGKKQGNIMLKDKNKSCWIKHTSETPKKTPTVGVAAK